VAGALLEKKFPGRMEANVNNCMEKVNPVVVFYDINFTNIAHIVISENF
jgi:hypothetical protein